jgi:hypothetical protein
MAAALIAVTALLAIARDANRPRLAWLSLPFLFYATGVRHNGIMATLPLMVACVLIALPTQSWRRRALAAIALAALIVVGNDRLSLALCNGARVAPTQTNFVHDLVGISRATDEKLLPPTFFTTYPELSEEQLRDFYDPEGSDPIVFQAHIMPTRDREVVGDIRRAWLRAVAHHPRTWLALRGRMMARQLGLGEAGASYTFHSDENQRIDAEHFADWQLGVSWHPSRLHAWLFSRLDRGLQNSVLFHAWIYLAFALVALSWAQRRRRIDALTIALGASIFCYVLPLFVVAPGPDFRYVYWPVMAALLIPARLAALERS